MALATGSMVILPNWAKGWHKNHLLATQSCFTAEEEKLLTTLADAIIPAGGENVGALSVLSLIHISEPTRLESKSRIPS